MPLFRLSAFCSSKWARASKWVKFEPAGSFRVKFAVTRRFFDSKSKILVNENHRQSEKIKSRPIPDLFFFVRFKGKLNEKISSFQQIEFKEFPNFPLIQEVIFLTREVFEKFCGSKTSHKFYNDAFENTESQIDPHTPDRFTPYTPVV